MSLEQTIVNALISHVSAPNVVSALEAELETYIQTKTGIPASVQEEAAQELKLAFSSLFQTLVKLEASAAKPGTVEPTPPAPPKAG